MSTISGIIVILIFLIVVPVLAVAGSYHYIKSHIFITDGPVGNVKSYCSVFLEFLIGGWIAVALILEFVGLFIDFVMEHWKWFAGGGAVIIALLILSAVASDDKNKQVEKDKNSSTTTSTEQATTAKNEGENQGTVSEESDIEKNTFNTTEESPVVENNLTNRTEACTNSAQNNNLELSRNFCSNCGAKLNENDQFCGNCGKPIN